MENTDMKHYFVINPIAGKANQTESLSQEIKQAFEKYSGQYEIYVPAGDAERYVREKVSTEPGEKTFMPAGRRHDFRGGQWSNRSTKCPFGCHCYRSCNDLLKTS